MIPRVIHYVWVGGPLTHLAKSCIESWKRNLPGYRFKLWNEENIPMDNHYVKYMYSKKKWAFVSDYVRFFVLEKEGGIYLDTDTEVLKSFDDLINQEAFFGKTKDGVTAAGVIGAVPHHPIIKAILEVYDADTTHSLTRTSPMTVTSVLDKNTFSDVSVYGYEYFNPCDDGEKCSDEKLSFAYTRNHWAESWVPFARIRKILRKFGIMPYLKKLFS